VKTPETNAPAGPGLTIPLLLAPGLLALFVLLALAAPALTPVDPNSVNLRHALAPPGRGGLLGTDQLGRDVSARIAYGGRAALMTGVSATILSTTIALLVGGGSGYIGGKLDSVVVGFLDAALTLPGVLVTLAFLGIFGTGRLSLVVALVGLSWATDARVLRATLVGVKDRAYVEAARAVGAGPLHVARRHLLPDLLSTTVILASLTLAEVLLVVSGLSFLGLGTQPPDADWGTMLADSRSVFAQAPWLMLAPGMCIVLFSALASLSGDALRDLTNPHLRAVR
jgi:peptide/nickel transport system permease protein